MGSLRPEHPAVSDAWMLVKAGGDSVVERNSRASREVLRALVDFDHSAGVS
jgi:hypothetical protein